MSSQEGKHLDSCVSVTYLGHSSVTCLRWRRLPRKIIRVEVEMFDGVSNVGHINNREAWIILILRPKIGWLRKRIICHVQRKKSFYTSFLWSIRVKTNSFHLEILRRSDKIFMISKSDKILPDPAPYWMTHR